MSCVSRRRWAISTAAVVVGLALASGAAGQTSTGAMRDATHLGGPTAFYAPPLRTAASLKQMAARRGMADDIRTVLSDNGIPETADAVLATLSGASTSVKGGFCDEATPADGVIVECDFRPGSTLLWMAYRPDAPKGNRKPGRLENVRWAAKKPFRAFLFRVTNDYRVYTFVLPVACSNLSLMSVVEIPGEPLSISVDRVCDPATGNVRATIRANSRDIGRVQRVRVAINGQPAGELTAPAWTLTTTRAGDYTFDATDARDRSYALAPRTIRVEVCPPPPPPPAPKTIVAPTCVITMSAARAQGGYEITVDATRSTTGASGVAPAVSVELRDDAGTAVGQKVLDGSLVGKFTVRRHGTYRGMATVTTTPAVEVGANRYEGTASCDASVVIERPAGMAFFFDVLGGKERRERPFDDTTTDEEFAQCSPLAGVKFGIGKRSQSGWEVAGAVGVAISLVTDDNKVKESALFTDLELNKHFSQGVFIGTGLSLWDITRSDTWTPAWLLHFGIPLAKGSRATLYFLGEGRLFFDGIDNIENNYLVWAGIRMRFGR